jgi:dsDNA-specific endonuclease/ATPase MutS2
MNEALSVLDPNGLKIAAFTVDSPELQVIREEKLHTEALLQRETDMSAKNVLTTKRFMLVKKEDAEESKVLGELSEQLREHIPVFLANMDNIGILDLTIAKAHLALNYGAIRPMISENGILSFCNMSNPYVADALAKNNQNVTKISITLTKGVTIITGANMGGKSVSMKTVVLNAMLCQLGFFVFAEKAEIPLFDDIYLVSEDMQDVQRGLSSFGAEILRFNDIAARLKTGFLLVALDEFARGTNPEEGASIVRAIASHLSEAGSVCLMSTHYDRVVLPQFKHYQVVGLHLPGAEREAKHDLSFIAAHMDYSLVEAEPHAVPPRDAFTICKLIGLDEEVLRRIEKEYK